MKSNRGRGTDNWAALVNPVGWRSKNTRLVSSFLYGGDGRIAEEPQLDEEHRTLIKELGDILRGMAPKDPKNGRSRD